MQRYINVTKKRQKDKNSFYTINFKGGGPPWF